MMMIGWIYSTDRSSILGELGLRTNILVCAILHLCKNTGKETDPLTRQIIVVVHSDPQTFVDIPSKQMIRLYV